MRIKIEDMARVLSGYLFKSGPRPAAHSGVCLVGRKDMDASRTMYLDVKRLQRIDFDGITTELAPKDILFANRGNCLVRILPNFAGRRIVAREVLTIIRPDGRKVIPEFLYIKLCEKGAMGEIAEGASGRASKFVTVSALKETELEIPEIPTQEKIVGAYLAAEKLKIAFGTKLNSIGIMQEAIGRSFLEGFEGEKASLEDSILSFMKIDPAINRLTSEMKRRLHSLDIKA